MTEPGRITRAVTSGRSESYVQRIPLGGARVLEARRPRIPGVCGGATKRIGMPRKEAAVSYGSGRSLEPIATHRVGHLATRWLGLFALGGGGHSADARCVYPDPVLVQDGDHGCPTHARGPGRGQGPGHQLRRAGPAGCRAVPGGQPAVAPRLGPGCLQDRRADVGGSGDRDPTQRGVPGEEKWEATGGSQDDDRGTDGCVLGHRLRLRRLAISCALLVVRIRNLNGAVMALSGVGTLLSVLFVVLGAPDDAHSEVVVGAIALPTVYLIAIGKLRTSLQDTDEELWARTGAPQCRCAGCGRERAS